MLDKKNRLPLYVQVKDFIIGQIDSGKYPPDSRLPTETELTNLLRVGRGTVRAALGELEREGRIEKKHGIGTFVRSPRRSYSFEPIVSLAYSLNKTGLEIKNKTIVSEIAKPGGKLLERWSSVALAGHLKRLRVAGGKPVAIEDSWFLPGLFETVIKLAPSESIARAILTHPGINIERVELSILVRKPDANEKKNLRLSKDKRVAEMTRWIYTANDPLPVNFVCFVMPEEFMGASFISGSE